MAQQPVTTPFSRRSQLASSGDSTVFVPHHLFAILSHAHTFDEQEKMRDKLLIITTDNGENIQLKLLEMFPAPHEKCVCSLSWFRIFYGFFSFFSIIILQITY